ASVIKTSGNHLLGLIERILDLSRIEAGKLELAEEAFDLHQLVHGVTAIFEAQAKKKNIRVEARIDPDVPFALLGDAQHLKQVLINLIGNAVKFTELGSVSTHVRLKFDAQGASQLRIRIQDTGIGISQAAQKKIFEQFTQADNSVTRRYGGSGLGTTISKQLVNLMGGEIHLQSEEGRGSCFTLTLPYRIQQRSGNERQLSPIRTLLLADEPTGRRFSRMMQRWNADTVCMHDEASLLSALVDAESCGQAFDALIIDRSLLQCKAELMAQAVRSKPRLEQMELILLDHAANQGADSIMHAAGFNAVLHPPFEESLLFNALHAASVIQQAPAEVISIAEAYQKRQGMQSLKILLAEDNPVNQEVIGEVLTRAGHSVQLVEDGEKALDALSGEERFDLILLDMNMPEVSGLDVLKQFRFADTRASTPVLMLSADAMPETIRQCREAGANDYLTKPVEASRLLQAVARFGQTEEPEAVSAPTRIKTAPAEADILDADMLQELVWITGSKEKMDEFIHLFESSGIKHIEVMHKAAGQGDVHAFCLAAHALKGSAGTMGLLKISAPYHEIESRKPALDIEELKTFATVFETIYREGCNALKGFSEQMDPPSG
ncbi:MAG: ATP-binding protein, partial [Mariprofundaceae bacterium]|nr:ATP-binding protein [Mariprofundaceae bacterium]